MNANILIIIIIIIFLVYTILFWYADIGKNSRMMAYFQSLFWLGIIIAFLTLIMKESKRKVDDNKKYIHHISEMQEIGMIDIEKMFILNFPELFPLYREMNSHNYILSKMPDPPNIDVIKQQQLETSVCNIIFQRIENIYSEAILFDEFETSTYFLEFMITLRLWFKSERLRRIWDFNKHKYFSVDTIKFIEKKILS